MNRFFRATFTSVACMVLGVVSANADLLTNGSFEQGSFVNQGFETDTFNAGATTINGWTVVGRQLSWINVGNAWGLSAQDGNLFLDLTAFNSGPPFGGVSQTISTVAGDQYVLDFELGTYTQRWGGPPVSILAAAGGTSQTFTVATTSTKSTWTPFSLAFTATGPSTVITLTGAAGVAYIGLDNVSVNQTAGGIAPEPASSSFALLGLGLGLCGFAKRRWSAGRARLLT